MPTPLAARLLLGIALAAMAGCGPPEAEAAPYRWTGAESDSCAVTLCLNGAGRAEHPGNVVVDELCAELPGLIERCSGESCLPTFRFNDIEGARAAFAEVAAEVADDTGENGRCPVSLLGYSYGGVNAAELARQLLDDEQLPEALRRVDRMVLLDPYSPFQSGPVDVPAVERLWVHRHSEAPASDCSRESSIGPYEGVAPRCDEASECTDYDWSLSTWADDIGHCTITERARPAVTFSLVTGLDPELADDELELPPTVPVATR